MKVAPLRTSLDKIFRDIPCSVCERSLACAQRLLDGSLCFCCSPASDTKYSVPNSSFWVWGEFALHLKIPNATFSSHPCENCRLCL